MARERAPRVRDLRGTPEERMKQLEDFVGDVSRYLDALPVLEVREAIVRGAGDAVRVHVGSRLPPAGVVVIQTTELETGTVAAPGPAAWRWVQSRDEQGRSEIELTPPSGLTSGTVYVLRLLIVGGN